jgi:hypothetical protein
MKTDDRIHAQHWGKMARGSAPVSNTTIEKNNFWRYSHERSNQCLTTGSRER